MNGPAILVPVPAELERAAAETGLAADGVASLTAGFAPHFIRFHELADKARGITDREPQAARVMRLEMKAVRVAAEKTRKSLKEDSLRRGKAIDGINDLLSYQLVPFEKRLEEIEKAEEIADAIRKAALKACRSDALRPFADPEFYDLGNMPEDQWQQLLAGTKVAHQAKLEAERAAVVKAAAEAKAIAEARAKREAEMVAERERLRTENERLAGIAATERKAREQAETKAAAERAKAARVTKAAADAHQAEVAKARADLAASTAMVAKAAEAQRAKERAEDQRAAATLAATARAAAAPDKAKVTALALAIRAVAIPPLTSPAGSALATRISEQITKFVAWLEAEGARL